MRNPSSWDERFADERYCDSCEKHVKAMYDHVTGRRVCRACHERSSAARVNLFGVRWY